MTDPGDRSRGLPLQAERTYRQVAAVYLLRDDGAALLQHRDDTPEIPHGGIWVPPGGHSDPGEAIDACARREFLEETGYVVGELHLLAEFLDDHAQGFPPLWLTIFWARYDGVQVPVCREGQALEFMPRARALALRIPQYLVDLWDGALSASCLTAVQG